MCSDNRLMRPFLPTFFLALSLGACALPPNAVRPPAKIAAPAATDLSATDALDALVRIAALGPEQQRAERARLDDERSPGPAAQFRLALLLGHEDDPAALERALKILGAIEADGPRAQALLDLAKSALKAQLDAQKQAARALELQERIEQIKALEKSLQQRDAAPKPR